MNWDKLAEKENWDEEHIIRARRILEEEKTRKTKWDVLVYWGALILAIVGNFLVNVALIPVFITMNWYTTLLTLVLAGVSFGVLFVHLLRDIEISDPKHHVIAGIFLPVFAGIVSFVTVRLSNKVSLAAGTDLLVTQSVIIIPLFYIISFTLPYAISLKKRMFF
jgi:hypothetical protein